MIAIFHHKQLRGFLLGAGDSSMLRTRRAALNLLQPITFL
jgi:hypothetical protein